MVRVCKIARVIKKLTRCVTQASAKFRFEFGGLWDAVLAVQSPLARSQQDKTHELLLSLFRQISQSLNDPRQLAFHAHALKSMSLNLGARRMVELSQKLEELGRSGNTADAPALLKDLETAFAQTKQHLLPLRSR